MLKKTFTLIELLISIIVLGIGVLTIVQVAINYLGIADSTKLKTQATFLSQEGISLINFLKHTNLKRNTQRNCFKLDSTTFDCIEEIEASKKYKIYYNPINYYGLIGKKIVLLQQSNTTFQDNILYFHTGKISGKDIFWYDYDSTNGKKTFFARYIQVKKVYSQADSTYLNPENILKVNSVVKYKKGALSGEITLESFVSKY